MKPALAALMASAAVLALAACSAPASSAAAACKDFAAWQDAQDGNNYAALDMSELQAARSAAPSGTLHNDISGLLDMVRYAHSHPNARSMAGVGVDVVMQDCHASD